MPRKRLTGHLNSMSSIAPLPIQIHTLHYDPELWVTCPTYPPLSNPYAQRNRSRDSQGSGQHIRPGSAASEPLAPATIAQPYGE